MAKPRTPSERAKLAFWSARVASFNKASLAQLDKVMDRFERSSLVAKRPIICIDLDRTIHDYRTGQKGMGPPLPGARSAICTLREHGYDVWIYTTRMAEDPESRYHVEQWLRNHDIPFDGTTGSKIHAVLYVDDLGYHFRGDWDDELPYILGRLATERQLREREKEATWSTSST